jgi:hypothetical protein
MGAPTALAAITVSARRRGLPQHRGRNPNQQSGAPSGQTGSAAGPDPETRQAASAGRRAESHPGRHRRAPEARTSYREVFAIGEFRALFSAQVLPSAGDQFAQVAMAILVYGRTHSAFLTAVAYALTYLPPIAGGPLLSGLADLFPAAGS